MLTERVKTGLNIAYRVEKKAAAMRCCVSRLNDAFLFASINDESNVRMDIENGSVTRLIYEDGSFTIAEVGNTDYIKRLSTLSRTFILRETFGS